MAYDDYQPSPETLATTSDELLIEDEVLEVYDTIASLPDDESLTELLEVFYEEHRTLAHGHADVPGIYGLPGDIVARWNRSRYVFPSVELDDETPLIEHLLAESDDAAAAIPAYHIGFDVGLSQAPGQPSFALIRLHEDSSGIAITLRKDNTRQKDSFEIFDEAGKPIGRIQPREVVQILCSLLDRSADQYPEEHSDKALDVLFEELGNCHGLLQREYRITSELEPLPADNGAAIFGAILYTEQENTTDSVRSFVVERQQRYADLDADVVWRMKVHYSCESLRNPDNDRTPAAIALEKVVASPAVYHIELVDCENVINGLASPVLPDTDQLKMFVDTIKEVAGAASEHLELRLDELEPPTN
ncbi:MAG: hypothetical protein JWN38_921 [Candidatus Saccharibacteria bacterium]|nr:hypothetical protein [Candidatus Saccharibacteria bacterium]